MNNIEKNIICFVSGLGIGILSGKVYYEKKYRMKLQGVTFNSDSKDMKPETSIEEPEEEKDPKESSEINKNKQDLSSMAQKVMEEAPRVDYSTPTPAELERKDTDPVIEEDFVLEPDDFGELGDEDYEVVTIFYLADGNFVYENGNRFEPVEEPQKKIGYEAIRLLRSEPLPEVMYVRNNRLKIDYEIVLDDRTLNEGEDNYED